MAATYTMRPLSETASANTPCKYQAHGECSGRGFADFAFVNDATGELGAAYCTHHAKELRKNKFVRFERQHGRCAICGKRGGSFTEHEVRELLPT